MTETAAWGAAPGFLPPAVAARAARDDAREALEAKRAEAERESLAEARHARAVELYCQQAEARGQVLDVLAVARGEVRGRSVDDILAAAAMASAVEDRRAELRAWQQGHGQPERLHVEVGEPQLLTSAARSETGRAIATRARRFADVLSARRRLAEAERAAAASKNDYGFVCELRTRESDDPFVAVTASRRRGGTVPADSGLRFR